MKLANGYYILVRNILRECSVAFTKFRFYGAPSHTEMYKIGAGMSFEEHTHTRVVDALNKCLGEAFERHQREGDVERWLDDIKTAGEDCIVTSAGRAPTIDSTRLRTISEIPGETNCVELILRIPATDLPRVRRSLVLLLRTMGLLKRIKLFLRGMRKGSTKLVMQLTPDQLEVLLDALETEMPEGVNVVSVKALNQEETKYWTKLIPNPQVEIDLLSGDWEDRVEQFARSEIRSIRILDAIGAQFHALARVLSHFLYSLGFLLWLMPWPALQSRGMHRFLSFANVSLLSGIQSSEGNLELRRLLPHALLWWPLLVVAAGSAICSPLLVRQPLSVLLVVVTSGVLLWFHGGLPCGTTISANGSYATVPLAIGFSVAHSIASWVLGEPQDIGNYLTNLAPFTRVVGGVPGSSIVVIAQNSWILAALMLFVIGASIWVTAIIMPGPQPQPTLAKAKDGSVPPKTFGAGVLCGSMCGGGIGLIAGLTKAFGNSTLGFTEAFLLVGSSAFAGSVLLKTRRWSHVAMFVAAYAVLSFLILTTCFKSSGTIAFLTNSIATGWLHATFFTLAYLVGAEIGGRRAGIWACVLEGCGGFLWFAIAQLL